MKKQYILLATLILRLLFCNAQVTFLSNIPPVSIFPVKSPGGIDNQLRDSIMSLPGIKGYWPLSNTYERGRNLVDSSLNATYFGKINSSFPFPGGNDAVRFTDNNDNVSIPSSAFNTTGNWDNGWLMFWVNSDTIIYGNGQINNALLFNAPHYRMYFVKSDTLGYGRHVFGCDNPPAKPYFEYSKNHSEWDFITYNWNSTSNNIKLYYNGQKVYFGESGAAPGPIDTASIGRINGWKGAIAHFAFGTGNLTDQQVEGIWNIVYPKAHSIFGCGDSKTANDNDRWLPLLAGALINETGDMWREAPYRIGLPGAKTNAILSYISPRIDTASYDPDIILVSGGANDLSQMVGGSLDSAGWVNRMYPVLDTLHGRWPTAKIFWIKPYRDDYSDGRYIPHALNMAKWIDAALNLPKYSSFAYPGLDENTWFKPNISLYSDDRIHYNNSGHLKAIELWMQILKPYISN